MAITLSRGGVTLTLPDALDWSDEWAWTPVEQSSERSVTGALIVDVGVKQGGRAITLEGSEDAAWIRRGDLLTLQQWAALPGEVLTLHLRGVDRPVIFDHERGAMEASPIVFFADPLDDDFYRVTLRFIEVDE